MNNFECPRCGHCCQAKGEEHMNREDIIRMAREAGFTEGDISLFPDLIAHFAALVAEHERAACAALCDEREEIFQKYYTKGLPALCAEAIRARGNT